MASAGASSGGDFASGEYSRADRRLELHFRSSLGLVTYHIGRISLAHEDLMTYTGHRRDARYPGLSTDPLEAFRHFASDLECFSSDFISGSGAALLNDKAAALAAAEKPAFVALSYERRL